MVDNPAEGCLVSGAEAVKARAEYSVNCFCLFSDRPSSGKQAFARAMIDDGLFKRFPKADVILGQHVMCMPAGMIGGHIGVTTSAADSLQIKLFGRGAHGSMPVAIDRSQCSFCRPEPQTRRHALLDKSMVLLNDVV